MGVVDLHPPSFAFVAFEKVDGFILDHDDILLVVPLRLEWKLIDAKVVPLQEIPDHLGDQVGRLFTVVVFGIVLVDPKGGNFSAQTGITGDCANLLAVKPVGCGIVVSGGVPHANGSEINAHQVGISEDGFHLGQVRGDLPEAIGFKKQSVHQVNLFL